MRGGFYSARHGGDAVEVIDEADEGREFEREVGQGAEDGAVAEAFDDFEDHGAEVADGERSEAVGGVEAREAAGIEEADVNLGGAVAVVDAVAAGDGAVEVAGGEEEEAAGFEEAGNERDRGGGFGEVFDDLDQTDDVELGGGLAGDFVEVEDAEAVGGAEKFGVGADVVAGELEGAAGERRALAEKFEEAAGAAAEVEPVQRGRGNRGRRGRCGRRGRRGRRVRGGRRGEMGFGEAGEVGEFEGAVGAAVVAVFGFVVDEGVGAGAAVVGVVVDFEAGEGFDEEEFAGAALVERKFRADEFAGFFPAENEVGGAAGAADRGGGPGRSESGPPFRCENQRERRRSTAPVAQRPRLRGQFFGT